MTKRHASGGAFIKTEITHELWARFKTLANSNGYTRAELIRKLIECWVDEFENGEKTVGSQTCD